MAQETQEFGIRFGAMAPRLSEQIENQGLKYKTEIILGFQKNIDSLLNLRFSGILIDSVYGKLQEKLYKKIVAHVKKINKLKQINEWK